MDNDFTEIGNALSKSNWLVQRCQCPVEQPQVYTERYPWLPDEVVCFLSSFEVVVSPSRTAWLTTHAELSGNTESAFAWNQWELESLSAAEGDPGWQEAIRRFWDDHFPLLLSVKSGYAYIAIRTDLTIVAGEGPEFEETENIADSFPSFLKLLVESDSSTDRWV